MNTTQKTYLISLALILAMGQLNCSLRLYDYLEATGVINPSELVEGREAGYVEPGNFQLVFGSEKGAHGFAERLNDLLHLRREKFLEFVFSSPSTKGGQ